MRDFFALLDEPRRPWLDQNQLKAKFLQLSTAMHPDRIQTSIEEERQAVNTRFTALNDAYNTLREPKARLLHLIELERENKPTGIEEVPSEFMQSFVAVGQLCRDVDLFIVEKEKVTAPLLKVTMFQRGMEWIEKLNQLVAELDTQLVTSERELQSMNELWEKAPLPGHAERASVLPLNQLSQLYRTISFISRWIGQLRERIVRLSF